MYVVALEPSRNELIVGPSEALGRSELTAANVNWTAGRPVPSGSRVQCQIRYSGQPLDCTVYPQEDGGVLVAFEEPVRGISPGQGAVFYEGPLCLGGGLIERGDPSEDPAAAEMSPAHRVSLD